MKLSFASLKIFAPVVVTGLFLCLPLVSLAVDAGYTNNPSSPGGLTNNPTVPAGTTGNLTSGKIDNPLKVTNFCQLFKIILDAVLIIGMPIAVLFLVFVGLKFILAQGKPEKISEAQKNLMYTVIGIAIFLGAWAMVKVIAATLQALGVSAVNECVR